MKWLRGVLGAVLAVSLVVTVFFTSFRVVVFNREYMDHEMDRLGIAQKVGMTSEDLSEVFDEILRYLEGEREDLVIHTTVDGVEREAFNEKEKLHMGDVLVLFEKGFGIYYWGVAMLVAALVVSVLWKRERKRLVYTYLKNAVIGFGIFFAAIGAIALLLISDFNRYFTLFHEIFFDNDLWLLNPATDLMINLVPEQFFFDTAMTIGMIFLGSALVMSAAAVFGWVRLRKSRITYEK